jgi:hypothetical protein
MYQGCGSKGGQIHICPVSVADEYPQPAIDSLAPDVYPVPIICRFLSTGVPDSEGLAVPNLPYRLRMDIHNQRKLISVGLIRGCSDGL